MRVAVTVTTDAVAVVLFAWRADVIHFGATLVSGAKLIHWS